MITGLIAFWFVELSTIPFYIYEMWSDFINRFLVTRLIYKLISCSKCFGFWLGLVYYQDIIWAIISSLTAITASKLFSRL